MKKHKTPRSGKVAPDPNQLLRDAAALLHKDGAPAALQWLQQALATAKNLPLPAMLTILARQLFAQNPAVVVALGHAAQAHDATTPELLATQMQAHDLLGEHQAARALAVRLIEMDDIAPETTIMVANLLCRLEEKERALAAAKRAFAQVAEPVKHAGTVLYIALKHADWPFVDQLTGLLRAAYARGDFSSQEGPRTHVLWCDDEATNIQLLKTWSARMLNKRLAEPPRFALAPAAGRRLRIGYLSSDFRDHPTARLINGLLRHHDRSRFDITLYDSGWDDGSAMRAEVVSHADALRSVATLGDLEAAALIRNDQIDVLIELNGPTRANRMGVLQYRAAPVQIDYLGWPGSVGGDPVDYIIADPYTVPEGSEQRYPEKVIRIQQVYQINDYAAKQRAPVPERAEVGLPEGVLVLGAFNAINKVRGEVWQAWMDILKAVPNAVLWLLDPGVVARRHMLEFTQQCGVHPNRIIVAPRMAQDAHLARMQYCDLMLDPWPYGGHTSTADAIFAGVPVIALEGQNFAGRVSAALLRSAGLDVLVQQDAPSYVQLAVRLLRDPQELARIKQWVCDKALQSDIFNATSKARQLEAAYVHVYERARKGLPPKHLNIDPGGITQASTAPTVVTEEKLPPALSPSALAATEKEVCRIPLVLVCGPWSSGTSAVAGMLAHAGLQAPGPYVQVNDPRTSATYELKSFQTVLRSLASEQTLQKITSPAEALQRLRQFRDEVLRPLIEQTPDAPSVMLKHGLAPLFLPELCALFEVRIVGVLRPLEAIEATRIRRNWWPSLGQQGAQVLYRALFDHLVNADTPFHLVRYPELLAAPAVEFDKLMAFCRVQPTDAQRQAALAFVDRPAKHSKHKD